MAKHSPLRIFTTVLAIMGFIVLATPVAFYVSTGPFTLYKLSLGNIGDYLNKGMLNTDKHTDKHFTDKHAKLNKDLHVWSLRRYPITFRQTL